MKLKLVTVVTKKKKTKIPPRSPSWRKEAAMETSLDVLTIVR